MRRRIATLFITGMRKLGGLELRVRQAKLKTQFAGLLQISTLSALVH